MSTTSGYVELCDMGTEAWQTIRSQADIRSIPRAIEHSSQEALQHAEQSQSPIVSRP